MYAFSADEVYPIGGSRQGSDNPIGAGDYRYAYFKKVSAHVCYVLRRSPRASYFSYVT